MKVKDAIHAALSKSKEGECRRQNNLYKSSASPDKLIRLFNCTFRNEGFGEPPPMSQKVRGMLSGFIKVCRRSGWEEGGIYSTVEQLVKCWNYIKKQEHHTLNGKRAALGDRPSLLEFLICRETILSAIFKASTHQIEPTSSESKTIEVKLARKRFFPTEEEMQNEYNQLMEDL